MVFYDQLSDFIYSLGVELFGVASAQDYISSFPDKPSPRLFVKGAKSIIIIGIPFEPTVMRTVLFTELANAEKKLTNSSMGGKRNIPIEKYFLQEEVELMKVDLTSMAYKITRYLRKNGHETMPMLVCKQDSETGRAPFYHMPAMYLAGLGTIGKNCSIITPEFGPRLFVTTIITACELPVGKPLEKDLCTSCNLCVQYCPVGALDGKWKNINACYEYNGCSTCIAICPVGKIRALPAKELREYLKSHKK